MASKTVAGWVAAAVLVAGSAAASAQSAPTGTWATETGNYQFRWGGAASDGTYLYFFGGPSNFNSYRLMRRYDPVTNAWLELAIMPTNVSWNTGAFHSGRIFSFGNSNTGNGAIYQYTIANNTWTTLGATLSGNRYYAGAATLGDRIYIAGGAQGPIYDLLDEFNPATGTITPRANMPGAVWRNAVAAVPTLNKIYSISGLNSGSQQTAVCYEYTPPDSDPGTTNDNTWTTRTPMTWNSAQQIRQGAFAFTLNDRIYVTGGHNGQAYQAMTMEYNPMIDAWTRRADFVYPRAFHGGAVLAGKGYVYGGEVTYTTCEEYTPPVFGSAPDAPTAVGQSGSQADSALQALPDTNERAGWTNNQVTFSATITDPDATQQVRLRVRVKPTTVTSWAAATVLDSGLVAQGPVSITWTIPVPGAFDWQWRAEDAYANSYPSTPGAWADAFDNANSPDFRSDQVSPADPVAASPDRIDIQVDAPQSGVIQLRWIESTDNGPVSGISYEIQVARDGGFIDMEAQLTSPAGTDTYSVNLTVARTDKHWRVRAHDVGGNVSAWSPPLTFRVTYDDRVNHGSGDAKSGCGLGAGAVPSVAALLAALVLAVAGLRRLGPA